MNRQELNNKLFSEDVYKQLRYTAIHYTQDNNECDNLLMTVVEYWLNMSDERVKAIYETNGLAGCISYMCKGIRMEYTSPRSNYHYTYRKERKDKLQDVYDYTDADGVSTNAMHQIEYKEETNEYTEQWDIIETLLDNDIEWYSAQLWKLNKVEKYSLDYIHTSTGIPRNSIFNTVKNTTRELKRLVDLRKLEEEKANAFGMMNEDEYNATYNPPAPLPLDYVEYDDLYNAFVKCKGSARKVSKLLTISNNRVMKYKKYHGITIDRYSHFTKDFLIGAFERHRTINAVCKYYKISDGKLKELMDKYGVEKPQKQKKEKSI